MNIGMITYGDVGNWYLGKDGTLLHLKKCYGMLLYCETPEGRVYYPAHDVMRQLSAKDVEKRLQKLQAEKEKN